MGTFVCCSHSGGRQELKLVDPHYQRSDADVGKDDAVPAQLKTWDPDVKIKRIPLPLPMVLNEISFFRSYVNSLLINGNVILPRFERLFLDDGVHDYPDADLIANYELQVEALYREAGYAPIWANADHLVTYGGTWHCLAAQVPRL